MPPSVAEHADLLWWALGIMAGANMTILGMIARYCWKQMQRHEAKTDKALSLLYAICLQLRPDGVDCDELRKALCNSGE